MTTTLETTQRRADGHTPFSTIANDDSLEFATIEDIRKVFQPGAPQAAKTAASAFQKAFNAVYDKPQHEPYRMKVDQMVKSIEKVNIAGLEGAEKILSAIEVAGVAKALKEYEQGRRTPGLETLAQTHKKLSEAFAPLHRHLEKINSNPFNGRLMPSLTQRIKPENPEKVKARLMSAGFL